MNKNQKIILIVAFIIIAAILIYWQTQGGDILTKTQVQVERVDELFNTTYMEWENKFVLGLDYAGTASAVIAVLSGILIFLFRNKKKEKQ
jgi:membrane-bound acyltransferase YfiQ involved in biofilm formation